MLTLLLPLLACTDKDTSASGDTGLTADCEPAVETCNGLDDDCDGEVDEEADDAVTLYADVDGDGFGDDTLGVLACADEPGLVSEGGDCDDTDAAVNPDAAEVCDGEDNDCDDLVDDEDDSLDTSSITPTYPDADGDGFGDAKSETLVCSPPPDHLTDGSDCDDGDPWVFPGAHEVCDGKKTDCEDRDWFSDAGLASFYSDSALAWTDLTDTFAAGTEASPVSWTADDGGALSLCEGTWHLDLSIEHTIQVVGVDGAEAVVLSGGDSHPIVTIDDPSASAVLTALTLERGLATHLLTVGDDTRTAGGAVWCSGSDLTLDRVILQDNTSTGYGGAVAAQGCTLSLTEVTAEGNSGYHGGAFASFESGFTLTGGALSSNHADAEGGAIYLGGGVTFTTDGATLADNTAAEGGAVRGEERGRAGSNTITLVDTTFSGNLANVGGAVSVDDGGELSCEGGTFEGNIAYDVGGAMALDIRGATITGTTFSGNEALDDGGALSLQMDVVAISECAFTDNLGEDGGAIDTEASRNEISSTTFTGNSASRSGGAIAMRDADAGLDGTDLTFDGNSCERDGGAIYASDGAQVSLESSALQGNSAGRSGGGIAADVADVALQDATLSANTAGGSRHGGAIWVENGELTCDAVSFDGHSATYGGALALELARGSVASSTFTDNSADEGGAAWLSLSELDVSDSDFSGNSPHDTYVSDVTQATSWGKGASFSCTIAGCE